MLRSLAPVGCLLATALPAAVASTANGAIATAAPNPATFEPPRKPPHARARQGHVSLPLSVSFTWWRRARLPAGDEVAVRSDHERAPLLDRRRPVVDIVIRSRTMPWYVSITTSNRLVPNDSGPLREIIALPDPATGVHAFGDGPRPLYMRLVGTGKGRRVLLRIPTSRLMRMVHVNAKWQSWTRAFTPRGVGSTRVWYFRLEAPGRR